ncbi:MAG: FAD-binding oxidoreductase, partial [Planctomycetes bacterium]|nr:FAD-binding oxidoreductase [Planctomycetota bacterium]
MNLIKPVTIEKENCPAVTEAEEIAERCQEFLGDESRLKAESVEAVYMPESIAQAADAVAKINGEGKTCVVSGGLTGIAGAAAPIGADTVITMSKMNRLLAFGKDGDDYYVRTEPGLSLATLAEILGKKEVTALPCASDEEKATAESFAAGEEHLWFPVDPTEMTAHVGGVVSTNASGARTYRYGPVRDWVRALTVILSDGSIIKVRRGEVMAENGKFVIKNVAGETLTVELPDIEMPKTKNTIGYHIEKNLDLVDLLVGSEGTLGIVAEVELKLAPRPESVIGVLAVIAEEDNAITLVEKARACEEVSFDAIEYFDHDTLKLLKNKKDEDGAGSHIPDIPDWNGSAVYLEFSGSEEETEEACMPLEEILSEVGSSLDDTWAAMEPRELEEQKLFRHTVPEAVNTMIG